MVSASLNPLARALPPTVRCATSITLAEAARRCRAPSGRPVHPATLARWIFRGIKLANGNRLRLGAFRRSGQWFTSPELLECFLAAKTFARNWTEG
jgi:hypothetical protein